jgi:hypothetical protein
MQRFLLTSNFQGEASFQNLSGVSPAQSFDVHAPTLRRCPSDLSSSRSRRQKTKEFESKLYAASGAAILSRCLPRDRRHQLRFKSRNLSKEFRAMAVVCFLRHPQPCTPANGSPTAHLQLFLGPGPQNRLKETISYYKDILGVIFDGTPIVRQTSQLTKANNDKGLVTLTPNYLCLQCSATTTDQSRLAHGSDTRHRFCMCFGRLWRSTDWSRCRIESRSCVLPDVR